MSGNNSDMELVETTVEVVEIKESLSLKSSTPAGHVLVVSDLEPSEASIQKLLNTVGQEQISGCEECLKLFQDQTDPNNSGPSYVLDFPTSQGVPQRALLTLPFGLVIGRSGIPDAGVGVINQGQVVSPGMHFGPFEGELTTRENALTSDFSWEIYLGEDQYEYIDAAKESFSNWMRYVNFARNEEEANLLAVQYKGSIFYHCCRSIDIGDELTVWPSSKMYTEFSKVWAQLLTLRWNKSESTQSASSPMFVCSCCQLSFTTEAFLIRHINYLHAQPELSETVGEDHRDGAASDPSPASLVEVPEESVQSKTCDDCGRVFKQTPHLRRHKLCVHSNKRPYCCAHCRRSFSQASGLIRHQLVHKKQAVRKAPVRKKILSETEGAEQLDAAEAAESEAMRETKNPLDLVAAETSAAEAEECLLSCPLCGKGFTKAASYRKHKATAHQNLRPYVCSICQKCFRHYNDLKRHLKSHQKRSQSRLEVAVASEDVGLLPFCCAECSVCFPSVDDLQEHINELHSEDTSASAESQAGTTDRVQNPASVRPQAGSTDRVQNPASVRPRRLKATLNVSALTKLVAPKSKAGRAAPTETSSSDLDTKLVKFKWFSCNHCKRTYGNQEDLKAHKCTLRVFKCNQCEATFNKALLLQKHEQAEHLKVTSNICDRCNKCFTTATRLKLHQKSNCLKYHCTSEIFPCSLCPFSFTSKSYLIKHVRRHHTVGVQLPIHSDSQVDELDENTAGRAFPRCGASMKDFKSHDCKESVDFLYLCPECGKSFTNKYSLTQHQYLHTGEKPYVCTHCGKSFSTKYGLTQHRHIHTGEKPYVCTHCGKSFSFSGQLNVHLRTHTGEKPYLCTHCGESFRQSGDLKRHERKHTGFRPHSCLDCGKSFSRPQSLKAHQMLHQGQKLFKCTHCGKGFSRNYHLNRHYLKVHTKAP